MIKNAFRVFVKERPLAEKPRNMFDKNFKRYVTGCLTKKGYDSEDDAVYAAIRLGVFFDTTSSVYKCAFCGRWHVTHKGNDVVDQDGNVSPQNKEQKLACQELRDKHEKHVHKAKAIRYRNRKRQNIRKFCGRGKDDG